MTSFLKKAGLGVALGVTALSVAAPAQARGYHHRYHHGGDAAGAAIIGGIIGLGLGAAIASSNNNDRYYDNRYYDNGYYDNGYYAPPPRYYNYREDYRPRCYVQRRWDPYYHRNVRVRICR